MAAATSALHLVRSERPLVEGPRYKLVSRIATGGMAEVFLALMPSGCGTPKPVVIKRLWPELARDNEHRRMFLDEVRLTLALHHPNVVHAYESGIDGDYPYLAMEYLDGQSFKHVLDRLQPDGGLSLPLSLKIICDLLAGLEYVHGLADLSGKPLHVVHCDVSPQNVFITCDGAVKLIDFGIARSTLGFTPTAAQDGRGRVAYMAPEQAARTPFDHRADLFAVGVMLWEATVGQRLWHGLGDADLIARLCSAEPAPRLPAGRGFPPGLASICARALAFDPAERYATASEFQSDLATISTGSMPAQTRLLGGLVSRVFANSRALSRTMIQQSLRSEPAVGLATTVTTAVASDPAPAEPSSRSSGSLIAAVNDDVTQVGPPPARPVRPAPGVSLATITAIAAAGLLVCLGFGVHLRIRNAEPAHGPRAALRAETRSSTGLVDSHPKVESDAPAHPRISPLPDDARASVAPPQESPAPTQNHPRKRWKAVRVRAAEHAPTSTEHIPHDVFDTALPRVARPKAPTRSIDREDPYGP